MSDAGPDDGARPPGDAPADDTGARRRWIIIGSVVALVVLLAGFGLYLVLDDDSDTASTTTSTSTTATATTSRCLESLRGNQWNLSIGR